MTAPCPLCGQPALVAEVFGGMRMTACPCVPRDRCYILPFLPVVPLVAQPHIPEGIAVIKVSADPP